MNLQGTLQGASSAKGKISIPSVRDGSSIKQYSSVYEFPNRGSVSALYIDINSMPVTAGTKKTVSIFV